MMVLCATLLVTAPDICAQSAIYACGHIRRNRTEAINNLRNSGYTTAILFNVDVQEDGTLTTDYNWEEQRAAEAGGIICQNGEYVFPQYQPDYLNDIKDLLKAPTSINRIEICIGGWTNGSYGKIIKFIKAHGTGEETMLYKNFKALHDVLPEIVAVNNDQEQDYNVEYVTQFHRMLAKIGFKTTIAPYTNKEFWRQLVENLNSEDPGTVEIVYLQTYAGGASNRPADWRVFGDLPMYVGFDCEASSNISAMERNFRNWRNNDKVDGGFLWNYNSEDRNVNEWATAVNRIFPTVTAEDPAAIVCQNIDFGGYAIGLPVGTFHTADLALYGIRNKDITSVKVTDGYKVSLYDNDSFSGTPKVLTESESYLGDDWNDKTSAIKIEKIDDNSIKDVETDAAETLSVEVCNGYINITGACGQTIEIFNTAGQKLCDLPCTATGFTTVPTDAFPAGVYIIRVGTDTVKATIR